MSSSHKKQKLTGTDTFHCGIDCLMAVLDFLYVPREWRRIPVVCTSWRDASRAAKWFRPQCRGMRELHRVIHVPQLQFLELSDTTDAMLHWLSVACELRTLTILSLRQVSALGLEALAAIPKLQGLTIVNWFQVEKGAQALTLLTKLQRLNLGEYCHFRITDPELQTLTSLTQLQSLKLYCKGAIDWRTIAHFRALKELTLGAAGLPNASLQSFCALPLLEELDLIYGQYFTDDGLRALTSTKLRVLVLEACHLMTIGGVQSIASVTTLQQLRLWQCGASMNADQAVGCLSNLVNLNNLGIDWCSLTDIGAQTLLSLPKLQKVHLAGSPKLSWQCEKLLRMKCTKFIIG